VALTKITAPWTPEQVEALNAYQQLGMFHPFTCGTQSTSLVATEAGWICPCCTYKQDWAWEEMADPEFIRTLKEAHDQVLPPVKTDGTD
jgi:hypothetical protein